MSPVIRRTMLGAAILGVSACAAGADGGGDGAGLDGSDRPIAWERQVVYEAGGALAEGWSAFGDIDDVAFDAAGNLYVLDSQASQVHVVSPEGTLVRSMGTPGRGPGELGQTRGMTVFADGTVAVFDIAKFGLVVYRPDGEWLRDVSIDPTATGLITTPIMPMPFETVVARIGGRVRMSADGPPIEPGRPVVGVPLGEEAGDPTVLFTAWEPPEPGSNGEEATIQTEGGGAMTLQMNRMRAFTPELRLAATRDGRVLSVDSTTYRIRLHGPDGAVLDELTRPIPPITTTPAIEEKERTNRLESLEEGGGGGVRILAIGGGGGSSVQAPDMSEMMKNQIEGMVFYPEIQIIERIAVDWDDRIWVQRASGDPGEPGPTDIITPDGGYIGTLAPDGMRTPRAFGPDGLAVWVETDEFDAERVVVARIISTD